MMKISKSLLALGCLLMIAGVALAAIPVITSNFVHVTVTTTPTYVPTLSVIQEGASINETLEAKTAPSLPDPANPYGLWIENVTGAHGTFTYNTVGTTFDVSFVETDGKLTPSTGYSLIYYADNPGWTGIGPITVLTTGTSDTLGNLSISTTVTSIATDLPVPTDANSGMGAKIWLVPSSDVSGTTLTWDPTNFLFETALITYTQAAPAANTIDLWATIPTPTPAPTLNTQTPFVQVHFWVSTDGKVPTDPTKTWTEITGSPKTVTWGWYCGFAGTIQYPVGTNGEFDFGASVTPVGGSTITITPPYPQP